MTDERLIEEAAKAIRAEAYDGGHGTMGPDQFDGMCRLIAEAALAVFEKAHTPTDDEREVLALLIDPNALELHAYPFPLDAADAILAAGFRRSDVPEPSVEEARPGFFPNGKCRHYQLADGWAKIWCVRTDDGHTEHETVGGVRWTPDAAQGEPSDAPKAVTLDDVYEVTGLESLVAEARSRGEWCCEVGCGNGACETCPCCSAGWCVSGVDGIPDDAEDRERWLEVAAEHNPVAAALRAAGGAR